MSAGFIGSGNLGTVPNMREVEIEGDTRAVADMRVYFDWPVPQEDGSFVDSGGFWLTVSTWGRLAECCAGLLQKGMRVRVEGRLKEDSWEGEEGPRSELRLTADHVTLRWTAPRNWPPSVPNWLLPRLPPTVRALPCAVAPSPTSRGLKTLLAWRGRPITPSPPSAQSEYKYGT